MKKLLLSAIVILGFTAVSFGQSQATATANTTLITPISIAKSVDLRFGTIASSNTDGTISITSTSGGTVAVSGGVTQVSGSTTSSAKFTVTGEGNSSISILYPTDPILLTNTTGGKINTLSLAPSIPSSGASAHLGSGTLDIYVGGVLSVPALTVSGVYTNTTDLTLIVNYN